MLQREVRDLAYVARWGIARTNRTQYVDQHSFYVTLYAEWVWQQLFKGDGPGSKLELVDVYYWALRHDMEESFMSDIPGPVKRNIIDERKHSEYVGEQCEKRFGFNPRDMPAEIKKIIKVADLIDECMYLAGEIQMGNTALYSFYKNARDRLFTAMTNLNMGSQSLNEVDLALDHQRKGQSLSPVNDSDVQK